jgi:hypothetical protein
MDIEHIYARRMTLVPAALLLLSLSFGGCAASMAGSSLMDARAEVPVPPKIPSKTSAYPLVEDLPPPRDNPAMTPDERSKLQKDLLAARDRQATKKPKGPAPVAPVKP